MCCSLEVSTLPCCSRGWCWSRSPDAVYSAAARCVRSARGTGGLTRAWKCGACRSAARKRFRHPLLRKARWMISGGVCFPVEVAVAAVAAAAAAFRTRCTRRAHDVVNRGHNPLSPLCIIIHTLYGTRCSINRVPRLSFCLPCFVIHLQLRSGKWHRLLLSAHPRCSLRHSICLHLIDHDAAVQSCCGVSPMLHPQNMCATISARSAHRYSAHAAIQRPQHKYPRSSL